MTARCSASKPNVNDCDSVGNGPPARFHKPFPALPGEQADEKKCLHFSWQAFRDMASEPERGRLFGIIEDLVRWENTAL